METTGWIILHIHQNDVATNVLIFLLAIIIDFGVGCMGRKRKIGFGWAFAFSLFFGPLIGLIIVLCSKKKDVEFIDIDKK